MTTEYSDLKTLKKCLLSRKEYKPFPLYTDREAWANVHPDIKSRYLNENKKKQIMEYESSALVATGYMGLYRTGSRSGRWYDEVMSRRNILFEAMFAECFEGRGEYIDKIIDITWAICEETSWVIPPHNNHMHNHMLSGINKNALPDITDYNFIDLCAAECTAVLGWVYYFLKDLLDEQTPLVCKRIELEIMKKIVIPFMTHDDLTWYGFYGHKINNWNPWILSNIIPACLIVIKDEDLRLEFMSKALEKLDIYLNYTAKDGGSDEGPGYWNVGGGTCLDVLEIIRDATQGHVDILKTDFARNVSEYIAHANMGGSRHADFGDNGINYSFGYYAYRFAQLTNSDYLMSYALADENVKTCPNIHQSEAYRHMRIMFEYGDILDKPKGEFKHKDIWLPETEHLFVRSNDDTIALAAKAGYNNESHNHNDAGSFMYCIDGDMAICDPGGPTYTDKTFSPQRYEIWICAAGSHCCAEINGYDQHNGDEFRSKVLNAELNDKTVTLKMELHKTYEKGAGIDYYTREIVFDKATGNMTVTDDITLLEESDNLHIHYITARELVADGRSATITTKTGRKVTLTSDESNYVEIEMREWGDPNPKGLWGTDECTRILFKPNEKKKHHIIKVEITHD